MLNDIRAPKLRRDLGSLQATALVAGGIVGTSIFLIPSDVASMAQSPFLTIVIWLLAGIMAGSAALSFAELSAAMPNTGGTYVFLQRAYRSPLISFGFAWMMAIAYGSGAIAVVATMAVIFLKPVLETFGISIDGFTQPAAVLIISLFTIINAAGVKPGGLTQVVVTYLKLLLLFAVILIPFLVIGPSHNPMQMDPASSNDWFHVVQSITNGLILCLFAFSGAYFVTHVAEEIKNPTKNIPRAIIVGFSIVFALYVLVNLVFLSVVPFDELRASDGIAVDLVRRAIGPGGATFTSLAIVCSAVGVLNAQLLNYPRIVFALAKDGLFFDSIARVSPGTGVPRNAILFVGAWASVLVFSGSYIEILQFVAFVVHLFICLAVLAVIILRHREPDLHRPFKVWGYPWTPVLFLAISVVYLATLLLTKLSAVAVGIFIVLLGVPFFFFRKYRTANSPDLE